jgi:hypothetical protein
MRAPRVSAAASSGNMSEGKGGTGPLSLPLGMANSPGLTALSGLTAYGLWALLCYVLQSTWLPCVRARRSRKAHLDA